MNIIVTSMTRLGTYKDGGSLSVSFNGTSTEERYTLIFRVIWDTAFDRNRETPSYSRAELTVFRMTAYTSPITGITMPHEKEGYVDVTWDEAAALLEQLQPFYVSFQSTYRWVFPAMVKAAAAHGYPLSSE